MMQMRATKAPASDGVLPIFYQQFWGTIGPSVVQFVRDAFQQGSFDVNLNRSLIFLIPKGEAPASISLFCPIALSNVLVKIILKVVANRLKTIMPNLTVENQQSFIPGRQAVDNVVLAQETLHLFRHID